MAKQFLIDLGLVQKFFKHKHLRELFMEECIPPGLRDVQDMFRSWPEHYIEWRWGTLVEVILRFKTARTIIQYLFDDAVMQARFDKLVADSEKKKPAPAAVAASADKDTEAERAKEDEGSIKNIRLKDVKKVLKADAWWSKLEAFRIMNEVVQAMHMKLKRCPCHPPPDAVHGRVARLFCGTFSCPFMGCVTPWLATGDWRTYVLNVQRLREFDVLFACSPLSADDRADILDNYKQGCHLLLFELDGKITMWSETNPYVLFGLAADDAVDARRCGDKALRLWTESPAPELEHSRTKEFFMAGKLNDELMRFLNEGVALDQMPTLLAAVAELFLQSVLEISIESKHALAKARLLSFKNVSKAAFSLSLRQREINAEMDAGLARATRVAELFSHVKALPRFVSAFGMQEHPAVQADFLYNGMLMRKSIQDVFYHGDGMTKHLKLPEVSKEWDTGRRKERDAMAKAKAKSRAQSKGTVVGEHDLCSCLVSGAQRFLQAVCTAKCYMDSRIWFSSLTIGNHNMAYFRDKLRSATSIETSGFAGVDSGMSLPADAAIAAVAQFDPLEMESWHSHFFFKVVRPVPSMRPINISSAAAGVDSLDIAIVVSRCDMLDLSAGEAAVNALDDSSTNSVMTWSLPSDLDLDMFRSCVLEWQATGHIEVAVQDQRMVEGLDGRHVNMFFQRALDEGGVVVREDGMRDLADESLSLNHRVEPHLRDVALELERRGFAVCKLLLPERSLWQCTPAARNGLALRRRLTRVGPALQANPSKLQGAMCAWELCDLLIQSGWSLEVLGKGAKKAALVPFKAGGIKVFFLRHSYQALPRPYFLALLHAEAKGLVVPHCLTAGEYQELFPELFPKPVAMKDSEKPLHLMLEGEVQPEPLDDGQPDDVDGGGHRFEDEDAQGDEGDSGEDVEVVVEPSVKGSSSGSSSSTSSSSSDDGQPDDVDDGQPDDVGGGGHRRKLKPPNHYWGSYTFTYKGVTAKRRKPAWQVTCRWHGADEVLGTTCKRMLTVPSTDDGGASDLAVRRRLRWWACRGCDFAGSRARSDHQSWFKNWVGFSEDLLPSDEALAHLQWAPDESSPCQPARLKRRGH